MFIYFRDTLLNINGLSMNIDSYKDPNNCDHYNLELLQFGNIIKKYTFDTYNDAFNVMSHIDSNSRSIMSKWNLLLKDGIIYE